MTLEETRRALASGASDLLLRKRVGLRRQLLQAPKLQDIRIAVLGGPTTNELAAFLELLLLGEGFRPTFYHCDYNRYYEEAVLEPEKLIEFKPDVVHVCTSSLNVRGFPALNADAAAFDAAVTAEADRFSTVWQALHDKVGCQVIQNNFEPLPTSLLGNLDAVSFGGRTRFINALNLELARRAHGNRKVLIQDVATLAARVGLDRWYDWQRWYAYKLLTTTDGSLATARSLTAVVRALYGKSKKCLVLDLDNTLWGGVIGDDGADRIRIGRETAEAEAYTAFQEYCLSLRQRGVLLAVCSKNEEDIAKKGFAHPDSVLKLEHFAAFRANWQPKHENILSIAGELNLGVDSFVFVDDNPAERTLVAAQLPAVAVPDVGSDVAAYAGVIESMRYFESVGVSAEDLERAEQYAQNSQRAQLQAKFADYGEYLASLQMVAEIDGFSPEYLDRIAQLTNKTNQFNLTTRRYTLAEIEALANDREAVALYGKLTDMFGDNGLISVVVARKQAPTELHLDLWLMSCRVLKRDMELAMLDAVVQRARALGAKRLLGTYLKTAKNAMVADHYDKLGFTRLPQTPEDVERQRQRYELELAGYERKNRYITVKESAHGRHSR